MYDSNRNPREAYPLGVATEVHFACIQIKKLRHGRIPKHLVVRRWKVADGRDGSVEQWDQQDCAQQQKVGARRNVHLSELLIMLIVDIFLCIVGIFIFIFYFLFLYI